MWWRNTELNWTELNESKFCFSATSWLKHDKSGSTPWEITVRRLDTKDDDDDDENTEIKTWKQGETLWGYQMIIMNSHNFWKCLEQLWRDEVLNNTEDTPSKWKQWLVWTRHEQDRKWGWVYIVGALLRLISRFNKFILAVCLKQT